MLEISDLEAKNIIKKTYHKTQIQNRELLQGPVFYDTSFRINTNTNNDQLIARVCELQNGNLIFVFFSDGQDGDEGGIYSSIYTPNGIKIKNVFQVNTQFIKDQTMPRVASIPGGNFIIHWSSNSQNVDHSYDIWAKIYNIDGEVVKEEMQINQTSAGIQDESDMVVLSNGNLLFVWESENDQDGSFSGIYGNIWKPDLSQNILQEFNVNKIISDNQTNPRCVALNGNFVVVWQSKLTTNYYVQARLFDNAGNGNDKEITISHNNDFDRSYPIAIQLDGGDIVFAWQAVNQEGLPGTGWGIYARRFNQDLIAIDPEDILINTYTIGHQLMPFASSMTNGGIMICWESYNQLGNMYYSIQCQQYDKDFVKIGDEMLGVTRLNSSSSASVGINGNEILGLRQSNSKVVIVSSHDRNSDGSGYGLYAQFQYISQPSDLRLYFKKSILQSSVRIEPQAYTVGLLKSFDIEAGDYFSYSFVSGPGNDHNYIFSIDFNDNVQFIGDSDYIGQKQYSIRVRTTDKDGEFYEQTFKIDIIRTNAGPSDMVLVRDINKSIFENKRDFYVGKFQSIDIDVPDETFTYRLTNEIYGSDDNINFRVTTDGKLYLMYPANYQKKDLYNIALRSTDSYDVYFQKSIPIEISVLQCPIVEAKLIGVYVAFIQVIFGCKLNLNYGMNVPMIKSVIKWNDNGVLAPLDNTDSGSNSDRILFFDPPIVPQNLTKVMLNEADDEYDFSVMRIAAYAEDNTEVVINVHGLETSHNGEIKIQLNKFGYLYDSTENVGTYFSDTHAIVPSLDLQNNTQQMDFQMSCTQKSENHFLICINTKEQLTEIFGDTDIFNYVSVNYMGTGWKDGTEFISLKSLDQHPYCLSLTVLYDRKIVPFFNQTMKIELSYIYPLIPKVSELLSYDQTFRQSQKKEFSFFFVFNDMEKLYADASISPATVNFINTMVGWTQFGLLTGSIQIPSILARFSHIYNLVGLMMLFSLYRVKYSDNILNAFRILFEWPIRLCYPYGNVCNFVSEAYNFEFIYIRYYFPMLGAWLFIRIMAKVFLAWYFIQQGTRRKFKYVYVLMRLRKKLAKAMNKKKKRQLLELERDLKLLKLGIKVNKGEFGIDIDIDRGKAGWINLDNEEKIERENFLKKRLENVIGNVVLENEDENSMRIMQAEVRREMNRTGLSFKPEGGGKSMKNESKTNLSTTNLSDDKSKYDNDNDQNFFNKTLTNFRQTMNETWLNAFTKKKIETSEEKVNEDKGNILPPGKLKKIWFWWQSRLLYFSFAIHHFNFMEVIMYTFVVISRQAAGNDSGLVILDKLETCYLLIEISSILWIQYWLYTNACLIIKRKPLKNFVHKVFMNNGFRPSNPEISVKKVLCYCYKVNELSFKHLPMIVQENAFLLFFALFSYCFLKLPAMLIPANMLIFLLRFLFYAIKRSLIEAFCNVLLLGFNFALLFLWMSRINPELITLYSTQGWANMCEYLLYYLLITKLISVYFDIGSQRKLEPWKKSYKKNAVVPQDGLIGNGYEAPNNLIQIDYSETYNNTPTINLNHYDDVDGMNAPNDPVTMMKNNNKKSGFSKLALGPSTIRKEALKNDDSPRNRLDTLNNDSPRNRLNTHNTVNMTETDDLISPRFDKKIASMKAKYAKELNGGAGSPYKVDPEKNGTNVMNAVRNGKDNIDRRVTDITTEDIFGDDRKFDKKNARLEKTGFNNIMQMTSRNNPNSPSTLRDSQRTVATKLEKESPYKTHGGQDSLKNSKYDNRGSNLSQLGLQSMQQPRNSQFKNADNDQTIENHNDLILSAVSDKNRLLKKDHEADKDDDFESQYSQYF